MVFSLRSAYLHGQVILWFLPVIMGLLKIFLHQWNIKFLECKPYNSSQIRRCSIGDMNVVYGYSLGAVLFTTKTLAIYTLTKHLIKQTSNKNILIYNMFL